ncbi:hypothetical protein LZ30DRAFT_136567 [Colletotrichum cereale]|nr:hypothetical protein LZ30DRAFT_136567 [Colletotrichum cereale]
MTEYLDTHALQTPHRWACPSWTKPHADDRAAPALAPPPIASQTGGSSHFRQCQHSLAVPHLRGLPFVRSIETPRSLFRPGDRLILMTTHSLPPCPMLPTTTVPTRKVPPRHLLLGLPRGATQASGTGGWASLPRLHAGHLYTGGRARQRPRGRPASHRGSLGCWLTGRLPRHDFPADPPAQSREATDLLARVTCRPLIAGRGVALGSGTSEGQSLEVCFLGGYIWWRNRRSVKRPFVGNLLARDTSLARANGCSLGNACYRKHVGLERPLPCRVGFRDAPRQGGTHPPPSRWQRPRQTHKVSNARVSLARSRHGSGVLRSKMMCI